MQFFKSCLNPKSPTSVIPAEAGFLPRRNRPPSIPGRIDKALSSSPEIPPLFHPRGAAP